MSPMNPFSPPTHHPRPCKPAPTVCLRTGIPASSLTTSHATPSLSLHGKQSELSKDQPHSLRWASHRPPDEAPPPEWHFRPPHDLTDRKPQVPPKEKERSFPRQTSPRQVLAGLHSAPSVGETVALFLWSLSCYTAERSGVIIIYGKLKLLLIKASLKISKNVM